LAAILEFQQLGVLGRSWHVLDDVMAVVVRPIDRKQCARNKILVIEVIESDDETTAVW